MHLFYLAIASFVLNLHIASGDVKIERMKNIVLVPTSYKVLKNYLGVTSFIDIIDHCMPLKSGYHEAKEAKNRILERMFNQSLSICNKKREALYVSRLEQLDKSIKKRQDNPLSINDHSTLTTILAHAFSDLKWRVTRDAELSKLKLNVSNSSAVEGQSANEKNAKVFFPKLHKVLASKAPFARNIDGKKKIRRVLVAKPLKAQRSKGLLARNIRDTTSGTDSSDLKQIKATNDSTESFLEYFNSLPQDLLQNYTTLTLPNRENIGMTDTRYWWTWFIPGYESLWEHYAEDSVTNTVKQHDKFLKIMAQEITKHAFVINGQISHNDRSIKGIKKFVNLFNQSLTDQISFFNKYVTITESITEAVTQIRLDASALVDISAGFDQGLMDLTALSKLASDPTWHDFYDRLTIGKSYIRDYFRLDNRMYFAFESPIIDRSSFIYKSLNMKEWYSETSYEICDGETYVLYNATNNCTMEIGQPANDVVELSCFDEGKPAFHHECKNVTAKNRIAASKPQVVNIGDRLITQCYSNNITLLKHSLACPPYPISIPSNISFSIGSFFHNYEHKAQQFSQKSTMHLNTFDEDHSPWRQSIAEIIGDFDKMAQDNQAMKEQAKNMTILAVEPDNLRDNMAFLRENMVWILVLGTILVLVLVFKLKKSDLIKLVEAQMMLRLSEQSSGRKDLSENGSINISIGEPIAPTAPQYLSKKDTLRVNFVENDWPSRSQRFPPRPATPANFDRACSCCSLSEEIYI